MKSKSSKNFFNFMKKTPLFSLCLIALLLYIILQLGLYFSCDGHWQVRQDGVLEFVKRDGTIATDSNAYYRSLNIGIPNIEQKQGYFIKGNKSYIDSNGKKVKNDFVSDVNGDLYYFDNKGEVLEGGLYKIKNKLVYVSENNVIPCCKFVEIPYACIQKYNIDNENSIFKNRNTNIYVYTNENGEILLNKNIYVIDDNKYIIEKDGNIPRNQIYELNNRKYYLNIDGSIIEKGWYKDEFYLKDDGEILIDGFTDEGEYINSEGKVVFINNIKDIIMKKNIGEEFSFGKYYNKDENEKEDLTWVILDKNEKNVFLITKDIIDVVQYNDDLIDVTWESSTLRYFLNNSFKDVAFNLNEKQLIEDFEVENEGNYIYNIEKQKNTKDKVFILSKEEHREYFGNPDFKNGFLKDAAALPTTYASNKGLFLGEEDWYENYGIYWLRNNGNSKCNAMACIFTGNLDLGGYPINTKKIGIRPCIVLNYTKE